jgi:antirestriction protein
MERTPYSPGGELQDTPVALVPPYEEEQHEESHDERVIREGIEAAAREQREIDDRTARYIASQLHEGQASALYSLASSGAITEDVRDELTRDFDQQTEQVKTWINWLGTYCLNREDKGPVPNWAANAAALDREEDEARERQALFDRINAAGVTTLGHVAIVEGATDEDQDDEHDSFPWGDAMHWKPHDDAERARERLDELFGETPDEELGSVQDMGWFGLLKHEGRPGGIVLAQNGYGIRAMREYRSDEELSATWDGIREEHDAFVEATRAHAHEPGDREDFERGESTSGHNPEIWVGSLSDYNSGRLHGVWLDATLDAEELHQAVQFMLRNGYDRNAEEWAIMDYDDFCGLNLGEYESLEVVSRIAKGIAEHGEAFARWVEYVGERSAEALDRFEDHYLGKYDSAEEYAEYILEETESYRYLDEIPESLRMYAKFDTEQMGRDMEIELHVVEASDRGVHVFDPRM